MDPVELVATANSYAGGNLAAPTELADVYAATEVRSDFKGHPILVRFIESDSKPAERRYNAVVHDAETGSLITTGGGGANWNDAMADINWLNLDAYFG